MLNTYCCEELEVHLDAICGTTGTAEKQLTNGFDSSTENQAIFKAHFQKKIVAPEPVKKMKSTPLRRKIQSKNNPFDDFRRWFFCDIYARGRSVSHSFDQCIRGRWVSLQAA
jgi:hypothetical protein